MVVDACSARIDNHSLIYFLASSAAQPIRPNTSNKPPTNVQLPSMAH